MNDAKIKNPFIQIYESPQCRKPYQFPLLGFPLLLDIELTNACNLDCLMCPRQIMTRKIGFMEKQTFQKIIDEAFPYKPGIRFIRYGEPLLHKETFSFIDLAKQNGFVCHMTTNGILINNDIIDRIFSSGLDSIIFSFQGSTKEEYQKMRNNQSYDLLKVNIENLKRRRDKEERDKPFIQVTTTLLDETKEDKENFIRQWQDLSDRIDTWHTSLLRLRHIDRLKPFLSRQRVEEIVDQGRCLEVMTKLSIDWNGDVTACCSDYNGELVVGNIFKNSLKEIWDSRRLDKIRSILSDGRRNELILCRSCTTKFVEK